MVKWCKTSFVKWQKISQKKARSREIFQESIVRMVCYSKKATSVLFVRCLIHFPILSHCSTPLHNRRETHRSSLHVYYTHIKSQVFILRVYLPLYLAIIFYVPCIYTIRCGMGCSHIFSQSFFPLHICACTYIHHLIFSSRGGKKPISSSKIIPPQQ